MFIFASVQRANLSRVHVNFMARSRVSINPLYRGGAGGYSFYVRDGEQVLRQRKNNSNYGESASRTYAQMIRRIKWGNLVNVYKVLKSWQPKAYESKKKGQTDYNIFMQLNTNRTQVAFTKEMNEAGCEVFEQFQVSKGTLPAIACTFNDTNNHYVTDIAYNESITSSTTLGDFSAAIIAANPVFANGDNLAFVLLYNWEEPRTEFPQARCTYQEITLDTSSTALLSSVAAIGSRISVSESNVLQISFDSASAVYQNREVGIVIIRTRKDGGVLRVSSQSIVLNSVSLITPYTGDSWYEQCIASFGMTQEVPLDPNFKLAPVVNVTIDGRALSPYERVNRSHILRIGTNGSFSAVYRVYVDNVIISSLRSGEDFTEYLINNNGNVTIYRNNNVYLSYVVSGIDSNWGLPAAMLMGKTNNPQPNIPPQMLIDPVSENSTSCIFYPYMYNETYPRFLCRCYVRNMSADELTLDNCYYDNILIGPSTTAMSGSFMLNDVSKIARIIYKGKTIAIFNYQ